MITTNAGTAHTSAETSTATWRIKLTCYIYSLKQFWVRTVGLIQGPSSLRPALVARTVADGGMDSGVDRRIAVDLVSFYEINLAQISQEVDVIVHVARHGRR